MNKHGSRKVIQWKLDIKNYNAMIEHAPGNPADVFSRLVEPHTGPQMHGSTETANYFNLPNDNPEFSASKPSTQ